MTPGSTIEENPDDIDELRRRLKGKLSQKFYDDDNLFIRFLRARNHNIDAAEEMLKKHLVWRKTNKIDTIFSIYDVPEVIEKYGPLNFIGFSGENPVLYTNLGNVDSKGLLKSASVGEICTFVAMVLEKSITQMNVKNEKEGLHADQIIIIANLDNLPLSVVTHKPTIEAIITIVQMYDSNFPERLKAAYVINANSYFTMGWTLVRPFLNGRTFQKVHIFGKTNYQDTLLKALDNNVIPASIGGKLTDPDGDPNCKTLITLAGPIPEKFYKKKNAPKLSNATKLVVNRMSKVEIKVEVVNPGSTIEWEFEVKNKDIMFAVLLRDRSTGKDYEVVEKETFQTLSCTECGIFKCDQAGTYFLQFDNTYSWIFSKEIYYTVSVVEPTVDLNIDG